MTTITLDDELMNKVVQLGDYQNPQEAVSAILFKYVQNHQPKKSLFDKLHCDANLSDAEVEDLFQRNKDISRSIDL